jgi:hypothetical protein
MLIEKGSKWLIEKHTLQHQRMKFFHFYASQHHHSFATHFICIFGLQIEKHSPWHVHRKGDKEIIKIALRVKGIKFIWHLCDVCEKD